MPDRAPHYCATPGCPTITARRHCPAHAVAREHARPNWDVRRWYRTPRWKALRTRVLREAAYQCAACGHVCLTLEVDHVTKHHGDLTQFWDRANMQALCRSCHSRKTQLGD